MIYQEKTFTNLKDLPGLSEKLIANHLTLYQGYAKNINDVGRAIVDLEMADGMKKPEYAELNRRFAWEWNGVRLHELYFENLGQDETKLDESSALAKLIKKEFGEVEHFIEEIKSIASMRGIGWVVSYYDEKSDHLVNVWINEHDTGHLSGCKPLLVMDVFEHAYILDYGIKKPEYIETFFKLINWKIVQERLEK